MVARYVQFALPSIAMTIRDREFNTCKLTVLKLKVRHCEERSKPHNTRSLYVQFASPSLAMTIRERKPSVRLHNKIEWGNSNSFLGFYRGGMNDHCSILRKISNEDVMLRSIRQNDEHLL